MLANPRTTSSQEDPDITEQLATRRDAIRAGVSVSSRVAAGLAVGSVPRRSGGAGKRRLRARQLSGIIVEVLNFALTLEHLEAEFYTGDGSLPGCLHGQRSGNVRPDSQARSCPRGVSPLHPRRPGRTEAHLRLHRRNGARQWPVRGRVLQPAHLCRSRAGVRGYGSARVQGAGVVPDGQQDGAAIRAPHPLGGGASRRSGATAARAKVDRAGLARHLPHRHSPCTQGEDNIFHFILGPLSKSEENTWASTSRSPGAGADIVWPSPPADERKADGGELLTAALLVSSGWGFTSRGDAQELGPQRRFIMPGIYGSG